MGASVVDILAVSTLLKKKLKLHSVRIPVRGVSMFPTIVAGQKVVLIAKQPDDINIGDIVLYCMNNCLILHRIIYREKIAQEMMFLTRGDTCDTLDDWVVKDADIIGVVDEKLTFSKLYE